MTATPFKLLIVDDDVVDRMAIRRLLARTEMRCDVHEAGDALEARTALLSQPFDCVLLDYRLPQTDGLALLRDLREAGIDAPIIVLTGQGDEEIAVEIMKAGAADYLTKGALQAARLARSVEQAVLIRRAEQEREDLVTLVESSVDFIGIASLDGRPQWLNRSGLALVGIDSLEALREQALGYTVEPSDQPEFTALVAAAKASGRAGGEVRLVHQKTGERIPVSCDLFLLRDRTTGRPAKLATITRDLRPEKAVQAERERLYASERAARAEAEVANRAKDEFLATLSHELRTPLHAMLGWTRILKDGDLRGPEQARAIEIIERNARAQAQLIDDLLDVSRIAVGKLELSRRHTDLAEVVVAAVDALRPVAASRSVELAVTVASVATVGDPDRLQQVVWNLVSNAIKFTPRGGTVRVDLEADEATALVRVKDTGAGIRADFLPHVFERFRQADGSSTRAHGGLGLGLSIVRDLVELHGGTITAESDGDGRGATFTVRLPISLATAGARRAGHGTRRESLVGLRVLVVDDELDSRELLGTLLGMRGAEVALSDSVASALETMRRFLPHVLVSDIGMPHADGYALIQRVRALPADEGGAVPAIALTGYAREQDSRAALSAGFHSHLPKPIDADRLIDVVAELAGLVPGVVARGAG